jgi:hypothetical protein
MAGVRPNSMRGDVVAGLRDAGQSHFALHPGNGFRPRGVGCRKLLDATVANYEGHIRGQGRRKGEDGRGTRQKPGSGPRFFTTVEAVVKKGEETFEMRFYLFVFRHREESLPRPGEHDPANPRVARGADLRVSFDRWFANFVILWETARIFHFPCRKRPPPIQATGPASAENPRTRGASIASKWANGLILLYAVPRESSGRSPKNGEAGRASGWSSSFFTLRT